jgi:hypothetical protein
MLRLITWDRAGPLGKSGGPSIGPHEQVLNVMITCWWYGPSKSILLVDNRCLTLPLLLQWLWGVEKMDEDPQIGQPTYWGCSWEFLFLKSSSPVQHCWWLHERLPRTGTARRKRTGGIRRLARKVYVLCRCDSRISVTACLVTVIT